MQKLKRCPFCGSNAKLNLLRKNISDGHIKNQFYIKCIKCEISTPVYESDIYQDEEGLLHIDKDGVCEAFNMWNCRCDVKTDEEESGNE